MTRETIEKLPLFLSFQDLRRMGFTKEMIQKVIYTSNETGVCIPGKEQGKKKRMVMRDEFFKWLETQRINVDVDDNVDVEECSKMQSNTR